MRKLLLVVLVLGTLACPVATAIGCSCSEASEPRGCCPTSGAPCACCPSHSPGPAATLGDPGCNGSPHALSAPPVNEATPSPALTVGGPPPIGAARKAVHATPVQPAVPLHRQPLYLLERVLRR